MKNQNSQIQKMQNKIKEIMGDNFNNDSLDNNKKVNSGSLDKIQGTVYSNNTGVLQNTLSSVEANLKVAGSTFPKLTSQPKTGINNEKLKNSRLLTIKSKYYDSGSGSMKELVKNEDIFSLRKKK